MLGVNAALAAFDVEPGNSRSLALGNAASADPDPLSATQGNPAGLASILQLSVEIGYQRLFNLPELAVSQLGIAYPIAGWGVGLYLQSFGYDLYREIQLQVSVSRSIGRLASLGVAAGYNWLTIRDYGSDADLSLSAGLQARPIPNLIWGLWLRNLNQGQIGQSRDPFPQETATGISYNLKQQILAILELAKDPRYPETYKFGIEAFLNSYLIARASIQHQPNRPGLGFGVRWRSWQFDYGTTTHPELGWTHSLTLRWSGKRIDPASYPY